jgi:DNA polymerase, archaea type
MEIQFYPYDFDYKVKGGKVLMHLYSKLESGEKVCVVHEHQPFFYAQQKDEEKIKTLIVGEAQVTSIEKVEKELLGKMEQLYKVYVNFPKAVPSLAKALEEWGILCYERDVLFTHRYLRDMGIIPMTLVKATGEFDQSTPLRVPLFVAQSVMDVGKETLPKWRVLAVDIETYAKKKEINPEKNPILMIALYGVDENNNIMQKVLTWRNFSHKLEYLEIVQDEVELLKRFRTLLLQYQPDILTGYFSDGFDFPYVLTRAKKYNLKLDLGSDYSEPQVKANTGFRSSEVRIPGMLHIDVLKFVRNIFGISLKTDSYKLDAVAEELLGHRKHDVDLNQLAHVWDAEPEKLDDFCAYNLHDAHLTEQLCTKLLPAMIEFTKIVGLPTHDVIRMRFSRLVENYIMRRSMEFNVLAPNKAKGQELDKRREERIQGAFVFEPEPALYHDVVVFDFRSLYPTIISAHNVGPEGFRCFCCKQEEHVPEREGYWFCRREKKFLPKVLEQLVLRRVDLKRLIKEQREKKKDTKMLEARSYALKILANSFYGYLGFFGARWYCIECAASTTAYARNYIKKTIEKAKAKGFKVIYADTDSCFLTLGEKIIDQAMEFMNEINFDLPGHMELEYEGFFPRALFVSVKGSTKGAKKKYALLREDGTLKVTGFELVRRNVSELGKEIQQRVLELVLGNKKEEAIVYVKGRIEKLKSGEVPIEKLIIKTQITRELSQYTSVGPHVLVAKRLATLGEKITPGTVVQYVIERGEGLVRERAKLPSEVAKYDTEYYLHHQLLPAISSIFEVLGVSEDELLGKGKQTGLGSYF